MHGCQDSSNENGKVEDIKARHALARIWFDCSEQVEQSAFRGDAEVMPDILPCRLTNRDFFTHARAVLFALAIAAAPSTLAADAPGFRSIITTPAALLNGSPFLLTISPEKNVTEIKGSWMGKDVLFFRERSKQGRELWYALAGVDVEIVPGEYPLSVEATTGDGKTLHASSQILIEAARYRTGTLTVAPNFVEPDAATQKEIAGDKEIKDRIFARSADAPEWSGDFVRPVNEPSTDSFGTRRTFNGKLASIHRGMDFRAPSGTPIAAANSGTVVLAQKLFYEGNCVVIDHGLGFTTIYMHLSRIDVVSGQRVHKGEHLGLSGATGRVTGPHLHFAARWQGAYLDPAGLFKLNLVEKP
jgi:murein DD-endopeptidase MepM/ murein hydrolase activator NlpD